MNLQKEEKYQDYFISEVFGWQKVKLYKIKHWIFDFGGVMINKTFVLENLIDIINHDLGIETSRKDPFFKKHRRRASAGIISSRKFLKLLFEKYYNPDKEKKGALPPKKANVDYYLGIWFNIYNRVTNFSPAMEEIIERLHKAGYTVSLMSNTVDVHAKSNEMKGFFDLFDHVFLSNEIGIRKPDLEKYKYVLNKLDTKPKKCIFVDDKLRNLIPARELGMVVIKFESFEKFKNQLNELGIDEIREDMRKEIKKKYKKYKKYKKAYKKAKKEYKKAKKEFLKKKSKAEERKQNYLEKKRKYYKKKLKYKKYKEIKEEELIGKVKLEK
ncbi:MAG: Alpha-D-glucose-1-phosphate phosphatase YihX [Promethearchaeota archaeon]|nr:MAG: Alpha-D-glucose-1-phosphate phosphatase YihX [Candidatus Lokiarchaeota archaeon]